MKIIVVFFPLLFLLHHTGFTQIDHVPPLMEMRKVRFENQFYVLGEQVSQRRIMKMMKPYELASQEMKAGRRWRALAHTHAVLGSTVLVAAIASLGSPGFHTLAAAGVGLALFWPAIPFSRKGDAKIYSAIDHYNLRQSGLKKEVSMSLGFSLDQNGIGLQLKF